MAQFTFVFKNCFELAFPFFSSMLSSGHRDLWFRSWPTVVSSSFDALTLPWSLTVPLWCFRQCHITVPQGQFGELTSNFGLKNFHKIWVLQLLQMKVISGNVWVALNPFLQLHPCCYVRIQRGRPAVSGWSLADETLLPWRKSKTSVRPVSWIWMSSNRKIFWKILKGDLLQSTLWYLCKCEDVYNYT